MPKPGSRPSRPKCSGRPCACASRSPLACRCAVRRRGAGAARALSRSSATRSRPRSPARRAIRRAGGRSWRAARSGLCLLCHSGPFPEERFQGDLAPSLAGVGARWTEGQLRLRIVDAQPAQPGHDHAVLLPDRRPRRGSRAAFAGQAGPDRRADRGRRRVPRDPAGLEHETMTPAHAAADPSRRDPRRGAAVPAAGACLRSRCAPPGAAGRRRWRRRSATFAGEAAIRAGPGQARHPAAGRERQLRRPHRHGREPDDARPITSRRIARLQREEPAAERRRVPPRPALRPGERRRPASGSPPRRRVVAVARAQRRLVLVGHAPTSIVTLAACLEG